MGWLALTRRTTAGDGCSLPQPAWWPRSRAWLGVQRRRRRV